VCTELGFRRHQPQRNRPLDGMCSRGNAELAVDRSCLALDGVNRQVHLVGNFAQWIRSGQQWEQSHFGRGDAKVGGNLVVE